MTKTTGTGLTVKARHYDEDMHMTEYDILLHGEKIGYVEFTEITDEKDLEEIEETWAIRYLNSIEIAPEYRGKGFGTKILKYFAYKHGSYNICPTSEDSERLYARLGEEIEYSRAQHYIREIVDYCDDILGSIYEIA